MTRKQATRRGPSVTDGTRRARAIVGRLLVVALIGITSLPGGALAKDKALRVPDDAERVELVRVIDGDTFDARFLDGQYDGQTERVRLIGIDTPETNYSYGNQPECYGEQASKKTESLLVASSEIWLERDVSDEDPNGRLLRYVWIVSEIDGQVHFLNADLVRQGYAEAKTYRPNTTRQSTLDQAERDAIDASAGMWLACDASVSGDQTQENPDTGPDTAPIDRTATPIEDEPDAVCSLFDRQADAQDFLDLYPGLADLLDPDGNGRACDASFS